MPETRSLLILRSGAWHVAADSMGIEFVESTDVPAQPLCKLLGSPASGGTRLVRVGDVVISVQAIGVTQVPAHDVRPLPWLLAQREAVGWRGLVHLGGDEIVPLLDLWSLV